MSIGKHFDESGRRQTDTKQCDLHNAEHIILRQYIATVAFVRWRTTSKVIPHIKAYLHAAICRLRFITAHACFRNIPNHNNISN